MKILMVSNLYYPNIRGGAEEVVRTLAEKMVVEGNDVYILTLTDGADPHREKINGVNVIRVPLRNVYWPSVDQESQALKPLWHLLDISNTAMLPTIKKILSDLSPDVIHTHAIAGFSPIVWKVAKDLDIPTIHTLHDHYLLCSRTAMYRGGRACESRCFDCSLFSIPKVWQSRDLDTVVGVSKYILEIHQRFSGFPRAKQSVINNPIDSPLNASSRDIGTGRVRIGFIGSLYPQKGIHVVLDLCKKMKEYDFVIAGTGPEEIESQVKLGTAENENLIYLGRSEKERFYSMIDILLVPSLWKESASRVVIEAYSYGVPVIGSNLGGVAEFIQDAETGYIVDPSREDDIVEKINLIVSSRDVYKTFSYKALEYYAAYSVKDAAKEYLDEYKILLEDR
ncbi:glycosyltransferase family 4 protein [Deinococcus geothermalis]|uniref:glycosyltransferase family 4 protein n=1 Tax=Deinococcus geothermalis TaxID=68909 RepID=UPI002355D54B|nr:glycosyltransferase family 4 protein [Deinococcus geothermalis]